MKHQTIPFMVSMLVLFSGCALIENRTGHRPGKDLTTESPATLVISGSVGLPDVNMTGLSGSVSSNQDGTYRATVTTGWSGTVKPLRPGYMFDPESRQYSRIMENREHQDFKAKKQMYRLSGNVGIEGVVMQGLPGDPMTQDDGYYEVQVEQGWCGTVIPTKEGFVFHPAERHYTNMSKTQIHEDYQSRPAPPRTVQIKGRIVAQGMGVEGVQVRADNSSESILTDDQGRYHLTVPYGWSGQLTPQKPGFRFEPPFLSFEDLKHNIDCSKDVQWQSQPTQTQDIPASQSETVACVETEAPAEDPNRSWPDIVYVQDEPMPAPQDRELEQDLLTMCLILDEAVHGARLVEPLLSQDLKVISIKDYGVVFMLRVDYALAIPTDTPTPDTDNGPDEVWVQARQRLLRAQYTSQVVDKLGTAQTRQLQERLTGALKHTVNIRHLSPQNQVIVSISGLSGNPERPTYMTMHTELKQIMRLSSGELDGDAFRDYITVSIY